MKTLMVGCLFLVLAAGASAQTSDTPRHDLQKIRFTSGRFEIVGDLPTPPGEGPPPVIPYAWGAGPTNRVAHIERSKVLRIFLEKVFAVFLYDKPGSGGSTGEFDNSRPFEESAAGLHAGPEGRLSRHRRTDDIPGLLRNDCGMARPAAGSSGTRSARSPPPRQ